MLLTVFYRKEEKPKDLKQATGPLRTFSVCVKVRVGTFNLFSLVSN